MQLLHQMLVTVEVGANSELWCHIHDRCQDFPQEAQKSLNNLTIMSGEHHITYDCQQLHPNIKSIHPACFFSFLELSASACIDPNPASPTRLVAPVMLIPKCAKNIHKEIMDHSLTWCNSLKTPSYLWLWLLCKMMMSFPKFPQPGSSKISQQTLPSCQLTLPVLPNTKSILASSSPASSPLPQPALIITLLLQSAP